MSTQQGFYAMCAYKRYVNGENSLYDMNDTFFNLKYVSDNEVAVFAPDDVTAQIIFADYENGVKEKVTIKEITLEKGKNYILTDNEYDKIMLWETFGNMKPMTEAFRK